MSENKTFWTHVDCRGDKILLRGIEDGRRIKREIRYSPTMYVRSPRPSPTSLKTVYDEVVEPFQFDTIGKARNAIKDDPGFYYGYDKWPYVFIADRYPGTVEYDPSLVRIGNIDIETMADEGMPDIENADKEVTAITYKVGERIFVFGCRPYKPSDDRVVYVLCSDEAQLLSRFVDVWSSDDFCPDIITGWNIEGFDIPYLVNRITRILGEAMAKKLSPWRSLSEKSVFFRGREKRTKNPLGISVLDYQRLYHKLAVMTRAVDTPDDYKLNTVAHNEVGEKKIDYSEYESLHDLYLNDWQKYLDYNIHDVLLVEKIDDRRQLIDLILAMAYNAKVNFEDMLGSVRAWECILHHRLLAKGVVLPPRKPADGKKLVGAYVKDPEPQGYDWVVSFDLNSLYSHLIMQWNISPETRIGEVDRDYTTEEILEGAFIPYGGMLREKDVILSANSKLFTRRREGYLPEILREMYDARVDAKENSKRTAAEYERTKDPAVKKANARWKNMDKVAKTNLNAAYGVLTNQYFLFYDHANAEAITTSGQLAIKWVERKVNEFMNRACGTEGADYIIAMDTDSLYVNMGPFVEKYSPGESKSDDCDFLDRACRQIEENVIEKGYRELAELVNAREQKMKMKRETIADRGIWVGKKHYILNMLDEEGTRFKEPEIKIKGMAAVKSSTPPACRRKIKEAIRLIMTADERAVIDFIAGFRAEFDSLPFHEIAFPRGVSDLEKWQDDVRLYKSGTPIAVRAALLYNSLLRSHDIRDYDEIYSGDKIKFCYLRTPNPITENVFGTTGPIPRGLDVAPYIDRDTMYEKGFLVPIRSILDAIGWKSDVEDTATLDDFFA